MFDLGRITGIKISPKGISVGTPKITTSDLLGIGLTAATGGFSGFSSAGLKSLFNSATWAKDPLGSLNKATTLLGALGVGGSGGEAGQAVGGGSMGSTGPGATGDFLSQALMALSPYIAGEAANYAQTAGQQRQVTRQAAGALDPSRNVASAMATGNTLMGQGESMGRNAEAQARASGATDAAATGIALGQLNRSAEAAGTAMVNATSPAIVAQQRAAQAALLNPSSPILSQAMAINNAINNQAMAERQMGMSEEELRLRKQAQAPPSTFEAMLPIIGNILGNLQNTSAKSPATPAKTTPSTGSSGALRNPIFDGLRS